MRVPTHLSRREFVRLTALAAAGLAGPAGGRAADRPAAAPNADTVLAELLEGNQRFMKGEATHSGRKPTDFARLAEGQSPEAVVVGCADSRVPPELIFDQGVGDLFVVRVAGNVISGAGASVKGSIEYAVAELNVPLVLVLGHSQCGAVKAALKHLDANDAPPGAIGDLVATIRPAVLQARDRPGNLLDNAIRANVQRGVERLRTLEPILADRVKDGKVKVVGATYDLRGGKVTLVD
jgi:carbonic anhydrase